MVAVFPLRYPMKLEILYLGGIDNKRCTWSGIMGYLKGKTATMIFDKHANLKYKFGNKHFWSTGYYVNTVGSMRQL